MHFCRFNLEFLGLGYKPHKEVGYVFSIQSFELHRCKKCGKYVFIDINSYGCAYMETLENHIGLIEKCGYKPIGELLKEREE